MHPPGNKKMRKQKERKKKTPFKNLHTLNYPCSENQCLSYIKLKVQTFTEKKRGLKLTRDQINVAISKAFCRSKKLNEDYHGK